MFVFLYIRNGMVLKKLNFTFHLFAHSPMVFRSFCISTFEITEPYMGLDREVSSANNEVLQERLLVISLR